jgi:hypothetical protein
MQYNQWHYGRLASPRGVQLVSQINGLIDGVAAFSVTGFRQIPGIAATPFPSVPVPYGGVKMRFEEHPKLAEHISFLARQALPITMGQWNEFLHAIDQALFDERVKGVESVPALDARAELDIGGFELSDGPGTNTGHGHIWARPDGMKARCGGPGLCARCSRDQAQNAAKRTLGDAVRLARGGDAPPPGKQGYA